MFIFILVIHVIASLLLIAIILLQSGRGGGLTESFLGAESIFGTKTNSFMVRTTSVLAVIFLFTCVSLAIVSTQRSRSLIEKEMRQQSKKTEGPALPEQKEKTPNLSDVSVSPSKESAVQSQVLDKQETENLNPKNIVPEKSTKETK